jgi:alkaline phosphatase
MLFHLFLSLVLASAPEPGQYHRYRAARKNSLLSIVPVDGAEFLIGQYFDISIELHNIGSAAPKLDGVEATLNGQPLETSFNATFSPTDTWEFEYFADVEKKEAKQATKVGVSRLALRNVKLDNQGTFKVQVKIGNELVNAEWVVRKSGQQKVKNMILFIGDGMAPSMISAARYISKPTNFGKFGDNLLEMEKLGSIGKIITNGIDSIITDSANSASAFTTGQKGWNSALNVYVDTSDDPFDDPKVETLAEYIRRHRPGMCIGVVSTADIADATPASMFAHTRERGTAKEIIDQMINGSNGTWTPPAVKADVFFGGGGRSFCQGVVDGVVSKSCDTLNNKDQYSEFSKMGYTVVKDKDQLEAYQGSDPILGIFSLRNMVLLFKIGCLVGSNYLY